MKHPMQPVYRDHHGVIRFKPNKIIKHLQRLGIIDLNSLARYNFPEEDWNQLAQLIGYSVSGFGDLDYADPAIVADADRLAEMLLANPSPSSPA